MKVEAFNTVLFRVPQFSSEAELSSCWNELKQSIKVSSPDFFDVIQNMDIEDLQRQTQAVQLTVQKYFNRARYRSTPYGLFANIGLCNIAKHDSGKIVIGNQKIRHSFHNWPDLVERKSSLSATSIRKLRFQTNSLFYKIGDQLRYVFKDGVRFELSDIDYNDIVVSILNYCLNGKSFIDIEKEFIELFPNPKDIDQLMASLVENQLIYTDLHERIISESSTYKAVYHDSAYIIGQRALASGGLDASSISAIEDLIPRIQRLNGKQVSTLLESFKAKFVAKYDQEFVPIMNALDPEIGIGYGGMEKRSDTSTIIDEIIGGKNQDESESFEQTIITNLSKRSLENESEIDLLPYLSSSESKACKLPNTFNAILRFFKSRPVIEQMGGFTANAILGRFTLADHHLAKFCREIASAEGRANPNVLFFDIAYCGEPNVDNVNRRECIYEYQVNIFNYNPNPSSIPINDIFIGVRYDEVVLFSKSLQRRIIPRLASAYNYSRSDLPIFRLFCDIQGQGLNSSITPDLTNIFKNQNYIPQVTIKGIIIQPARWKINYSESLKNGASLSPVASRSGKYRFIKVGDADQTLMLDTDSDSDLHLLQSLLKVRKSLWVQDALFDDVPIITDDSDKPYCAEFVLSFFHENQIYQAIPSPTIRTSSVDHNFPPGSEWLYFEIYSHTNASDRILYKLITEFETQEKLSLTSWFFVRYNEGGDHIRLRLKPKHKEDVGSILCSVRNILESTDLKSFVQDFRICTYRREIERYGEQHIEAVEDLFNLDSEYIYQRFLFADVQSKYQSVVKLINTVGQAIFGHENLIHHLKQYSKNHNTEHNLKGKTYKKINSLYKENVQKGGEPSLDTEFEILAQQYVQCLNSVVSDLRPQLFGDLFHMHINRLFSEHQRIHEAIIYNHCVTAYHAMNFKRKLINRF